MDHPKLSKQEILYLLIECALSNIGNTPLFYLSVALANKYLSKQQPYLPLPLSPIALT